MTEKRLLLLGGSRLLLDAASVLLEKGLVCSLIVIISPRHSVELMPDGLSLKHCLLHLFSKYSTKSLILHVCAHLDGDEFKDACVESDLVVSISAAWIYNKRHIDLAGTIYQMHNTLLPLFRGGASISWMILTGERRSATTIFKIDQGIDTGESVFYQPYLFPVSCTKPIHYLDHSFCEATRALTCFIRSMTYNRNVVSNKYPSTSFRSTYFPRLEADIHGCINWSWSALQIKRFTDAFDDPYPGAFCRVQGLNERVFLKDAHIVHSLHEYHPFNAGTIYDIDEFGLHVCALGGSIIFGTATSKIGASVIPQLRLGDRLYSDMTELQMALSFRKFYKAKA